MIIYLSNIVDSVHTKLFYDSHFYRGTIRFLQDYFKGENSIVGVEIGVNKGEHAFCMLYHLPIEKLFLIDPFSEYDTYHEYKDMDAQFVKTRKYLERFEDKVVFIKKLSCDAVDDIPDDLDFVYIDGNHSYEFVKKDIELYYKKLKSGGVLCGHDFDAGHRGVVAAVCEFSNKKGLESSGNCSEWWIIKNINKKQSQKVRQ